MFARLVQGSASVLTYVYCFVTFRIISASLRWAQQCADTAAAVLLRVATPRFTGTVMPPLVELSPAALRVDHMAKPVLPVPATGAVMAAACVLSCGRLSS